MQQQQQRLDELQLRLRASAKRALSSAQQHQQYLDKSLRQLSPVKTLLAHTQRINELERKLTNELKHSKQQLAQLSAQLHAVSPLATLARGYSISFDAEVTQLTGA